MALKASMWSALAAGVLLTSSCLHRDPVEAVVLSSDSTGGGIGGTGIIGVITELGSIVVNGIKVDVQPDTPVRQDLDYVATDALRVGQVVAVQVVGRKDRPVSEMIDIRREVVGPITDLRPAEGRLAVMHQPVVLDEGAVIDLEPEHGLMVAVSGFRLIDRTIVATRIEPVPPLANAHLYGRYRVGAEGVEIDGVAIDGMAVSQDLFGREVLVKGLWADGRLRPVQFAVQPAAPFSGLHRTLSIAGFFDSYTNTLSDTPVEKASEPEDHVHLSDGREVPFGIFEGIWSSERSALEIDAQYSAHGLMDTPDRAEAVARSHP